MAGFYQLMIQWLTSHTPTWGDLVGRFWSGKHHRVAKGVNLITLVHTDTDGYCLPINFRLYNPNENARHY